MKNSPDLPIRTLHAPGRFPLPGDTNFYRYWGDVVDSDDVGNHNGKVDRQEIQSFIDKYAAAGDEPKVRQGKSAMEAYERAVALGPFGRGAQRAFVDAPNAVLYGVYVGVGLVLGAAEAVKEKLSG
jgi:hypothetical protein